MLFFLFFPRIPGAMSSSLLALGQGCCLPLADFRAGLAGLALQAAGYSLTANRSAASCRPRAHDNKASKPGKIHRTTTLYELPSTPPTAPGSLARHGLHDSRNTAVP